MRAPVQRKTHSEGTFTAKNSVKKCTFFAGWEDTLRDPPWWLSKSSWEVLYAKANKDEFRKSLETSSSKTRAIVYKTNGLVERWRESLGDRQILRSLYTACRHGCVWFVRAKQHLNSLIAGILRSRLVGSEGFGGLLANSNLFQRIQTWGNALLNSR